MDHWAQIVLEEHRNRQDSDWALFSDHAEEVHEEATIQPTLRLSSTTAAANFGHVEPKSGHAFNGLHLASTLFKKMEAKLNQVAYHLIF